MAGQYPRLVEADRGYTISYKDRLLYSSRSPRKRPETIVRSLTLRLHTLVIIPSPLLCYGIDLLLSDLPDDCHLLCVEIDEQLMRITLDNLPDFAKSSKVSLLRADTPEKIIEFLENIGFQRFRRVVPVPLSGGYGLYKKEYDRIFEKVDLFIRQYWQNRMTLIHLGRLWIRNILSNLARFSNDLDRQLISTSKPVVVAGAGESLEGSLSIIQNVREGIFLLAVDTALPTLKLSDLYPDAVIALEGQIANSYDFMDHKNIDFNLICDLTSHPSTLAATPCKKHFMLSYFSDNKFLQRLGKHELLPTVFEPLGSVGVAAVEIALKLTTAPIIITGLDFSYTLGKPHAAGAPSHTVSLLSQSRTHPVGWYVEAQARPLRDVVGLRDEALTTDMVLQSYGVGLAASLAGNLRVFDIRKTGIELNLQTLTDDALISLVDKCGSYRGDDKKGSEMKARGIDIEQISRFFAEEEMLLSTLIDEYKRGTCGVSALEAVDYIYLDFPDSHRYAELNDDFLLRAAASASDYLEHIKSAKKVLQRS
ncbi:MAG: DUF115 domain-containing protein [Spirochaetales bacterium]|jgi:hypothetical protein|nr:DUF115 domain-containing protein [Spirochaetales bacterium]